MDSFRWIQMWLSLILLLHITVAVQTKPFAVTPGVQVNLPCKNVTDTKDKCKSTTWTYTHSDKSITLFKKGKIHKDARVKSDRLTLEPDCSLVIKTVTAEDDGRYSCRHFRSGERHGEDTDYDLTVVTGEATKPIRAKATTTPTSKSTRSTAAAAESTPSETTTAASTITDLKQAWWWFVIVAAGVAALIITVVALVRWRRTEGNKTQMEENTADPEDGVHSEDQADPEDGVHYTSVSFTRKTDSEDQADPEDGVHYTSVSFTRKTDSEDQILGKDEDEDDDEAVTYTTVRTSSCSAGASADPSDLYATIIKLKK
ncbi:uncharacterized protein LOC115574678 [Sparus aurata]|uniref:uncharacterized protein LOC115574678 n=1 Tax=Sparus aurata TaxID=8175 RepID=UPI0011C0EB23|nr:uncharacterized protein LOC115574678 [Sparus aurata]